MRRGNIVTNLNLLSFSEYDLNEILKASQANKLVFFVGAGFSKFSETELVKIPTWSEIISELKDDLILPKENDYLKIAQLYFLKYGQYSYVKKIKSTIKDLDPSPFHKNLFELNPRYIITTNWDDLLEKTSQDMGLAYDLVSSDVDLAQSHLDKKIIKMHGDFRQNNFVFKEDDYLQYSYNFPLIENFIKGIFSTSTVVFLGYSYSDYNLKQIVSWVSTISKATPRKFLLQKKHDDAQSLYLRNHGISLLTPIKHDVNYHDLYFNFFNELKIIRMPNEFIKKIIVSSELEIEKINDNQSISEQDKIKYKSDVNKITIAKINKSIDSKLKALIQYKVLLPEQITKKLTNSTIEYEWTGVTLIAHDNYMTGDFDKYLRKANELYIHYAFSSNDIFNNVLRSVLKKALVKTVNYKSKNHEVSSPTKLDAVIYNKISFLYSKNSADFLLAHNKYGKLLNLLASDVKYHLNERNYILTTISMANFDNIYSILKQIQPSSINATEEDDLIDLESVTPFYFKSKIIDFPRELQNDLQDLVEILDFNETYKLYYKLDVESKKNLSYTQTRRNGGMAFSSDEYKLRNKLYSYLYFIIGNDILIEQYTEVKNLFEFNIISSIKHYLDEGAFYVEIIDLFILIKFCQTKSLKEISLELIKDKSIIKLNKIDEKNIFRIKRYLLNVLGNLCDLMDCKDDNSIKTTLVDNWINNLLVILGAVHWSSSQLKTIINSLIPLLDNITNSIVIYENIQYFLISNAFLYKNAHPDMFKILDVILEKIIAKRFNGYDNHIITSDNLDYIFGLSKTHNYTYNNIALLKLVLLEIQPYNDGAKKLITDRLLLSIKSVGSSEVVNMIDDFVKDNILNLPIITANDILERLTLVLNGYTMTEQFITDINKFIDDNIPNKVVDLSFIKSGFETRFPKLMELLINEKGIEKLKDILDNFNNKMNTLKNEGGL